MAKHRISLVTLDRGQTQEETKCRTNMRTADTADATNRLNMQIIITRSANAKVLSVTQRNSSRRDAGS